jgi:hypothetical protein
MEDDFIRDEARQVFARFVQQSTPRDQDTSDSNEDDRLLNQPIHTVDSDVVTRIGSQNEVVSSTSSAMFSFPPPTIDATAMYGRIVVTLNPFSQYVAPTAHYQLRDMQRITNWNHLAHFIFQGEGSSYVRTLTCHDTITRPLTSGSNVVFLYSMSVTFTPNTPFDSLFHLTHLWYTVTNTQGSIFYFDLVRQLYNGVPLTQLAGKIKCPYIGTYILFTPEQDGTSSHASTVSSSMPPTTSSTSVPTVPLLPASSATTTIATLNLSAGTTSVPPSTNLAMSAPSSNLPFTSTTGIVATPLPALQHSSESRESPSDSDSDDSQVRRQVKVSTVQWAGKKFSVTGKESSFRILRDTQSVRTLMCDNQLEDLVKHVGNFVHNYTSKVFREGILKQQSLSAISAGMSLVININHDLVRFQSIACYGITELQDRLYLQQYEFPVAMTVTSLHPAHYLTKTDADSCNYNITTYDMWVKSWKGYQLTLQMLLGFSYGSIVDNIVREIQQNNIGQMYEIDYLLWLTITMRALLFQYSSSEDAFTVEGSSTVFQPLHMTSLEWQSVITFLWLSFKSQLTYAKQYEYTLVVAKYKMVKHRPFTPKAVVKDVNVKAVNAPVKQKGQTVKKDTVAPPAKGILRKDKSPKVVFVPDDIKLCISNLAKQYSINTLIPECTADCRYMHYDQYSSTASKDSVLTKVQQLGDKLGLTDSQTQQFARKMKSDRNLK